MGIKIKILSSFLFCLLISINNIKGQNPTASFGSPNPTGCPPLITSFSDSSSGKIASYLWDFGNGSTSNLKNPSTIFKNPGKYDIKLIITDSSGNKDSLTKRAFIIVYKNPIADFYTDIQFLCSSDSISFFDSTILGDTAIKSWIWDIGDSLTYSSQNFTHKYSKPNDYSVYLTVLDYNDCKSSKLKAQNIHVLDEPIPNFQTDTTHDCFFPVKIKFYDSSKNSGGQPLSYYWDFGNGDTSSQKSPTNIYNQNGNFDVSLTLSIGNECVRTIKKKKSINISIPKADFELSDSVGCIPISVYFKNTSTNIRSNTSYIWNFGNGSKDTIPDTKYIYNKLGTFNISLILSDSNGCKDTITKKIILKDSLRFDFIFSATDTITCYNSLSTKFSYNTKDTIISQLWDFGDSMTSNLFSPSHNYNGIGSYNVSLSLIDINKCKLTKIKPNYIDVNSIKASFTVDHNDGCKNLKVKFKNTSFSNIPITSYLWKFGDGNYDTTENPSHIYLNSGTFYPTLIIKNAFGCIDSFTFKEINTADKPIANYTIRFDSGCKESKTPILENHTNQGIVKTNEMYWSFDGGTSESLDTNTIINHFYPQPGKYIIILKAVNKGCFSIFIDSVDIIRPIPVFNIIEDPCIQDSIKLVSTTVNPTHLWWYINNEYQNSLDSFTTFLPIGMHEIKLKSYDTASTCYDSTTIKHEIRADYVAGFKTNTKSKIICANVEITFTDTSYKSKTSTWYINDNSLLIFNTNPLKYTFRSIGLKTVKLVTKSDLGCMDSIVQTYNPSMPKTTILTTPKSICHLDNVTLINTSKSIVPIIRKYWLLAGDTLNNPTDTFNYKFNKFPKNANKGLILYFISIDQNGCQSIDSSNVLISNPVASYTISENKLFCDSTRVKLKFDFTKSFTIYSPSFSWFINGNLSSEKSSILKLVTDKDSIFKIQLVVHDSIYSCNNSNKIKDEILKVKKFKPDFLLSDSIGVCPPLVVQYNDSSFSENTKITSYKWEFGDGAVSYFPAPKRTYFLPGAYTVKLVVGDKEGCLDSIIKINAVKITGPIASITSDVNQGCYPVDVNFTLQGKNLIFFLWDLGNGVVTTDQNPKTTYNFTGKFNPYIIVRDSAGCELTYYIDTLITIYDYPKPEFSYDGVCKNIPITFINKTIYPSKEKIGIHDWNFGDGDSAMLIDTIIHTYTDRGKYKVKLTTISEHGCKKSKSVDLNISSIKADFDIVNDSVCEGTSVKIINSSTSDTNIVSWLYDYGNGDYDTIENPEYLYPNKGVFTTSLTVVDHFGCIDSISKTNLVSVFDSVTPTQLPMLRATVNSSSEVEFNWKNDTLKSILYTLLYTWDNDVFNPNPIILNKYNDSILLYKGLNTHENNYSFYVTNKTLCFDLPIFDTALRHQTVLLSTINDQNSITLNWNGYRGWDSVKTYHILRANLGDTLLTEVANVDGSVTSYIDRTVKCDYDYTYKILAEEYSGNYQISYSNFATASSLNPTEPNAPKIIRATVNSPNETQIDWDVSKYNINGIQNYILEKSTDGINYTKIDKTADSSCCDPFIDNNVNTNNQSYTYRLIANDQCNVKSKESNIGKTVLLKVSKEDDDSPKLLWTDYLKWDQGVEHYEVELKNNVNVFNKINNTPQNQINYTDSISDNSGLKYICYRIKAISYDSFSNGIPVFSYSNEGCVIGNSSVYVPNAFTPNSDNNNPKFKVYGSFLKSYNIQIYNRWGQRVFESENVNDSWDGTFKEVPVADGVFIYLIRAQGQDGKKINLKGNITLLR